MQLDQEFIKWVIAQAIGLILAVIIFQAYRQLVEHLKMMNEQLIRVVTDNTMSNTKLVTLIETQERNALRKADLENLLTTHDGRISKT